MQTLIKKILPIFVFLLLASVCQAANDFSGDGNCKALWSMDNGAIVTDSKGTNTLTNTNVTSDVGDFKEGDASGDFTTGTGDNLYIADGSLDSGFPGKNGELNKVFSIPLWVKIDTLPTGGDTDYIIGKYNIGGNSRSYAVSVVESGGSEYFRLHIGFNAGASADWYTHASDISVGIWYHVTVTWNDSIKAYHMRVWDDNASSILGSDISGTGANNISITTTGFTIGNKSDLGAEIDGKVDEVVVFNDILSSGEIDQIRAGTYVGPAPGGTASQVIIIGGG